MTEESLHALVDDRVFAQAVTLAGEVAGLSVAGPQVTATVAGAAVSVRVRLGGLDARCACPAAAPCPHAVAAVIAWVHAGADPAAELRAQLDDVLGGLAEEAGDCDPDDGWYPDTSELEDLLDQVGDLADGSPAAARDLAGHVAERIRRVLAAATCLTGDLSDALGRAEELCRGALYPAVPYTAGRSNVVRCAVRARACRGCRRAALCLARAAAASSSGSSGCSSW